jgi:seryl-tRNA synthetase
MLDIKFIRENTEKVKEGMKKRGVDEKLVNDLLKFDEERRKKIKEVEDLRSKRNKLSKKIAREKDEKKKKQLLKEGKEISKKIEKLEKELKEKEENFLNLLMKLPNLPFDDVPVGKDETQNVVLREIGERPKFDFKPKDHLEIGERLDLIDVKRGAKVAGTRFGYLKREAVLIEFALVRLAFDILLKENFVPVLPPVMLTQEMAKGTGYFEATDIEESYFIPKDNLFLIGTSEQSILSMHAGEVFEENELPKRYLGFSPCFRREAGSYGKDTRGIFRVHQFDKVEMFSFDKIENSKKEHLLFLEMEEKLMQLLKLPYRVVQVCTGEMGRPAAAQYDIETWFPGQNRYRETHSTSNCTDFQSRRLKIRYKTKSGKLEFVHTINGTAFAIGRTLIAILENYQQKDGSVRIPEVLQPYLPFKEIRR